MELQLEGKSKSIDGMRKCHKTMLNIFKEDIQLVNYWGPVQMCVFYLEYNYVPHKYKIILECERGFITMNVKNQEDHIFSPWMIFPEARYYHFEDVDKDVSQLIELTYKAIKENTIVFNSSDKVEKMSSTIQWDMQ